MLQRVLAPTKPLVLTAAMRPATALSADGPANLADAVALARHPGARGVLVALAGAVHAGDEVRKVSTIALDAFSSGDAGPVARLDNGHVRELRPWPGGEALGLAAIALDPAQWPRVAIVASHAGASGFEVDALVAAGVQGLVVAATGNGTLHHALDAALQRARAAGIPVLVATRCALGRLAEVPGAGALTPAQARVHLLLQLLLPKEPPMTNLLLRLAPLLAAALLAACGTVVQNPVTGRAERSVMDEAAEIAEAARPTPRW